MAFTSVVTHAVRPAKLHHKLGRHRCAQEKDARRDEPKCCAAGHCCGQIASERTVRDAWTVLRTALGNAVRDEILARNVAALLRVKKARTRKPRPWTVEEARKFLESARTDGDPLYAPTS
jgi:hypothetical protein